MGLFALGPLKPESEITAEENVDTALQNIKLWKDYPAGIYLLETFAVPQLLIAIKKLNTKQLDKE